MWPGLAEGPHPQCPRGPLDQVVAGVMATVAAVVAAVAVAVAVVAAAAGAEAEVGLVTANGKAPHISTLMQLTWPCHLSLCPFLGCGVLGLFLFPYVFWTGAQMYLRPSFSALAAALALCCFSLCSFII